MTSFPPFTDLVPHRPPMVFIDEVIEFSPTKLVASYCPPANHWAGSNGMPSFLGIEMIAQAIAAHNSLLVRQSNPESPPSIGLLLGTRKYESNQPTFSPGKPLKIMIEEVMQDPAGFGAFNGNIISNDGETFASAVVKVFRPPNFSEFIKSNRPQ